MSDEATLIDPSGIPHFIGDLSTLDTDVMLLTANAAQFRASGADVHTTFQELSAFYRAPEAHELFSSTQPVKSKADAFADALEKVTSALSEYASTVKPLVERLESLKAEATTFVNSVSGDDDWRTDHGKVETNNRLWREVNHTVAAFQAAERTCHNKITALVGGTTLTVDDGSHRKNTYGYRAEDLDHAAETPWGAPAEQEYEGWDWVTHQAGQLWDGFWTDGVMGTIHGLGTLVGADGWDAAGEAWKNLAKLGTASALTSATLGTWWLVPDDKLPSWLRDSRTVYKQTVKGLVAWDTWKTNPSRAAGAVGFNVLGLLGTDGVGAAASGTGKTAAVARALSVAGKVGRAVDPLTYVGKAGKFAFVKVSDAFTRLRNVNPTAPLDAAAIGGRYTPSDHPIPPAERPASLPEHAAEYIDDAGERVYLDTKTGDVLNADGTLRQHVGEAPHELSAKDHAELNSADRADRSEEPVGSGARAEHVQGGGSGDRLTSGAGGTAHEHGPGPSAGHEPPSHHAEGRPSELGPGSHEDSGGTGHGDQTAGHGHENPADSRDHTPGGTDSPGSSPGDAGAGTGPHAPRANEPLPEMTPEERAAHWDHLDRVEQRNLEDFDALKHDPDHGNKVRDSSEDEARVGLDLREQGRLPHDIQRPSEAALGEFYSPSTGRYYDIKGVHSDWPPFNDVRDKSQPFSGAYNPANNERWVKKLRGQIVKKKRIVILDVRNANQAAIDDIKSIVEKNGWEDNVIWYP
ncbi:hypothetical protein ACFOOM_16105 [Streptomyces echinoruber]|uniref:Uncharacterized protein n=1 Tax=Streptomyces echinoruber TaxID=68898 RepID=A0A918S0F3_9ACTN|nr:hypothetical protein [Streptomyces echinoruber]GHA19366.1 hypothetical protein GCM10010389_66310 [Streptomyces echinoruber]